LNLLSSLWKRPEIRGYVTFYQNAVCWLDISLTDLWVKRTFTANFCSLTFCCRIN